MSSTKLAPDDSVRLDTVSVLGSPGAKLPPDSTVTVTSVRKDPDGSYDGGFGAQTSSALRRFE